MVSFSRVRNFKCLDCYDTSAIPKIYKNKHVMTQVTVVLLLLEDEIIERGDIHINDYNGIVT